MQTPSKNSSSVHLQQSLFACAHTGKKDISGYLFIQQFFKGPCEVQFAHTFLHDIQSQRIHSSMYEFIITPEFMKGHNYTPLCGWIHLHGHLIHPCIEESGKASYLLPIKRLHRFHCIQIKLCFCLGLVTVTMIHEYDHHYVNVNKNLANRSMTNLC